MTPRAYPTLTVRALLLSAIAIVTILSIVAMRVWFGYREAYSSAVRDQADTAQLLEASTASMFQSVDLILDRAVAEVDLHQAPADDVLSQRFVEIADRLPFVHAVAFADPDGVIKSVARRDEGGHMHVADPGNIRTAMDLVEARTETPDNGIYISDTFRGARTGAPMVSALRFVRDSTGKVRGICIVGLRVTTFQQLYAGSISESESVAVYKTNGRLIYQGPSVGEGAPAFPSEPIFAALAKGDATGIYEAGVLHNRRLVAFRKSDSYPFVVGVGVTAAKISSQWLHASIALLAAAGLGVAAIAGLTWLLLRQIRQEEAASLDLRDNERRLEESQRIAGIGHFEFDPFTGTMKWSANTKAIHGVPDAFDLQSEFLAVFHPADRGDVDSLMKKMHQMPEEGTSEFRVVRANGDVRFVSYKWRLIEPMGNMPARIFGVAQDMTAVRHTESALRQNEERFRDLVECSSDFVWETNADGDLAVFTGRGTEAFATPPILKDLIQHGPEVAAGDCDVYSFLRATSRCEKFRNLAVPVRATNGEVRWVRTSGNPLFDGDGKFRGYRGAGTDITETRRQRQLDEERRKAEALGRLASGLAHEINNLLQPIIIYATFGAGDRTAGAGLRQYFSRIGRAAEGASHIVRNVLSFVRQRPPASEPVVLAEAVREITELLGDTLPAGISRVIGPIPEDLVVRVDRGGLAQAITNLITNAVEAMPSGELVTIAAEEIDLASDQATTMAILPGEYIRLTVADSGSGIAPEQIGQVFDPFFTTKPQGKGTGLGLSVVAGLAKSWGGVATVANLPRAGAVFSLYMPLVRRELAAAQ